MPHERYTSTKTSNPNQSHPLRWAAATLAGVIGVLGALNISEGRTVCEGQEVVTGSNPWNEAQRLAGRTGEPRNIDDLIAETNSANTTGALVVPESCEVKHDIKAANPLKETEWPDGPDK